jgi:hypothetical protein
MQKYCKQCYELKLKPIYPSLYFSERMEDSTESVPPSFYKILLALSIKITSLEPFAKISDNTLLSKTSLAEKLRIFGQIY